MSDAAPVPPEPSPDASAPAAPAKPSRMRRAMKWAAVLFVIAVAGVALVPTLLGTGWVRARILSWLDENLDRKVEFTKLSVGWFSGVRLEGLRVGDAKDPGTSLLEAPLVELHAPVFPLLFGRVLVDKFVVHDAVVHVVARGPDASNIDGVVKRKRVKKKRRGGAEEDSALPEISVPVEVRNLTIVYRDLKGREARQSGVTFEGRLETRGGPTTFDLKVPCGKDGGIRLSGEATLVEDDGTLLPPEEREVDATLEIKNVDAATNRDALALFLGDTPASGEVNGKITTHVVGMSPRKRLDVTSDFDVRLGRLGYGAAAAGAASKQGDDLTIRGHVEKKGDTFRFEGCKVRADGLVLDLDAAGAIEALDGTGKLDVDLARVAGALRAAGVNFKGTLAGRVVGSTRFTRAPSSGVGDFTLTALRAEGFVEKTPPVAVDSAEVHFDVVPGKERFDVKTLDVKLADLSANFHGSRTSDGEIDADATAKGDLGGLLARVRDLGFLPGGFSVNGTLDAQAHVGGKPEALVVDVKRLALTEKDARIEASGTRAADGALDFRASGSGDLGSLLGRARASGAGPKGIDEVKGRFAFEATAKGPMTALEIDVPKLHVDGDVFVEAYGRMSADGSISAEATDVHGKISDLLLLARRAGFLDKDVSIDGELRATAIVKGTREKPEVPHATLKLTGGPITADVSGSVDATGAVKADAVLDADVAACVDIARRAGFLDRDIPATGKLHATAKAAGTRERIEVPEFKATVKGGQLDADVVGRYGADGAITATCDASGDAAKLADLAKRAGYVESDFGATGTVTLRAKASGTRQKIAVPEFRAALSGGPADATVVGSFVDGSIVATLDASGDVDRVVRLAKEQGFVKREAATGCQFTLHAVATGPLDKIAVGDARLATTGPLKLDVSGQMDAARNLIAGGKVSGALQPVLDLAAAWSGQDAKKLDGTIEGSFTAAGTMEKFEASVPSMAVRAGSMKLDTDGTRTKDGVAGGHATFKGPIVELIAVASAFGFATDVDATGMLDATAQGSMTGPKCEGSLTAVATDLVVQKPLVNGKPFREPRLSITVPSAKYDLDTKTLDPMQPKIECEGASIVATVKKTGDVVSLDGTLAAQEAFARNHPELLNGGSFDVVSGPFTFEGDVSAGREKAATWTGGFTLDAGGVTAPYVRLSQAKAVGVIKDGVLVVDPITATMNQGPLSGKASIGLVGETPEHRLIVTGKDVQIEHELAPLLAHVAPFMAVGEEGRTGGKASIDLDAASKGFDAVSIKKWMTGQGVVGLEGAFAESTNWIGELMEFVGAGKRLEIKSVKIPFRIQNQKVVTGEAPIDGLGMTMRLGGNVGFDMKLDYLLRVKSGGSGGTLSKFASLFDKDGYLPLRLGGTLMKPKLKLPDLKDALKGGLESLLDRGKKEKDKEPPPPPPKKEEPPKKEDPPAPPPPNDDPPAPPPPK